MRTIVVLVILLLALSCNLIFKPVAGKMVQFEQQDTCKKILYAKVINYRTCSKQFPVFPTDLDLANISENEFILATKLMMLPDSSQQFITKGKFEKKWQTQCPKQLDSVSLVPYAEDSIDVFIRLRIPKTNTDEYFLYSEQRTLSFRSDTLSRTRVRMIDFKAFYANGQPNGPLFGKKNGSD